MQFLVYNCCSNERRAPLGKVEKGEKYKLNPEIQLVFNEILIHVILLLSLLFNYCSDVEIRYGVQIFVI